MANAADIDTVHDHGTTGMRGVDHNRASKLLDAVRRDRPQVHCLTNDAARTLTANVLLAIGAEPSLSYDPYEVRAFVESADGFLANLGTMTRDMKSAIDIGLTVCKERKLPWVLDPVMCNRSQKRKDYGFACLERKPAALRLNPVEAKALGGEALQKAVDGGTIVAMSGKVDHIYGKGRQAALGSGHDLMGSVTGMGCALGAVIAAFLTVSGDRFDCVSAACQIFALAGASASDQAAGPGSFVPAFLDALHNLEAEEIAERSAT